MSWLVKNMNKIERMKITCRYNFIVFIQFARCCAEYGANTGRKGVFENRFDV